MSKKIFCACALTVNVGVVVVASGCMWTAGPQNSQDLLGRLGKRS